MDYKNKLIDALESPDFEVTSNNPFRDPDHQEDDSPEVKTRSPYRTAAKRKAEIEARHQMEDLQFLKWRGFDPQDLDRVFR